MVKPVDQSNPAASDRPPDDSAVALARGPKAIRADGNATRARILAAAFRRIATDGYAALNVREIARDAGVNHALINYHFRSKAQLVLAVLDEANRRLLERQARMYAAPDSLADKWRQACAFYDEDLRSGFVRIMIELCAASISDAELRAQFMPRYLAWRRLVNDAVREAIERYRLDLPASADAIGSWIGTFWMGMELEMMLGIGEADGHHRAALEAMQSLLERLDAGAMRRDARKAPARGPAGAASTGGRRKRRVR